MRDARAPGFKFDAASERDIADLVAIDSDAPTPWTRDQFASEIAGAATPTLFVLRDSQTVARAFLAIRTVLDEISILNIAVHPEFRRQGLGRALLTELVATAKNTGARSIWLEVRPSNDAARSLYAAAGFAERGTRKDFYRKPIEDAIVLRLELDKTP